MSEQNKNRNKDKGRQNQPARFDTTPKQERQDDVEFSSESEFLDINGKKNKRKRK
ncbi:hypothetical protein [Oceanobacillus bengalensis]|uniref:hypothetical protein n=1 Tax=Oceanobacillus bengalensis TaxID=1435466 RepID=UPI0016014EE8|nr:hypothetical protein [Oceanobacillus bengalensis]